MDARRTISLALSFLWISQCVGFTISVVAHFQWMQSSRMFSSRDSNGYDALLNWIAGADDRNSQLSLQLSIGTSKYSGGGQGLFVTTDVARGEVLLIVPETHVISVENAWSDEVLGDAFCYLSDEGGAAGRMASLAGFVGWRC
ncbi:hypothetical protein MHU86_19012 [Fragilaria crotonensis]|nr:hypothetical protein MHU86_19012 [Fragilaria crotonensis]